MQKMRQEYQQKSAKILKCGRFQKEPKSKDLYSLHGSLVEHQLSIRGGACSSPCNSIIFKLGLSLSKDENAGNYISKLHAKLNCTLN